MDFNLIVFKVIIEVVDWVQFSDVDSHLLKGR